jgi:hypothetical protein
MRTDAQLPVNHSSGWVLEVPPSLPHEDLYTAMKATRGKRLNKPCKGSIPTGCDGDGLAAAVPKTRSGWKRRGGRLRGREKAEIIVHGEL